MSAGAVCGVSAGVKVGVHVHFPGVVVRSAGALWLRDRIIERLSTDLSAPLDWATVVDATVYRGSGLRMPWSGKRAGDRRVYAPVAELRRGADGGVAWADVAPPRGLAAVRAWVVRLSVRAFGELPTPLAGWEPAAAADGQEWVNGWGDLSASSESLERFAAALPAVAACLPARFADARFAGAVSLGGGESFALRSSSRKCLNLVDGREHTSSNVWFHVTRAGVCQRCYCRQPGTEGRAAGACRDFASEVWPLPQKALAVFFPPPPPPPPPRLKKRATSTLALHERQFYAIKQKRW